MCASGHVLAIGVCNFNLPMIRRAVEEIGAPIAAHQVEYHSSGRQFAGTCRKSGQNRPHLRISEVERIDHSESSLRM